MPVQFKGASRARQVTLAAAAGTAAAHRPIC